MPEVDEEQAPSGSARRPRRGRRSRRVLAGLVVLALVLVVAAASSRLVQRDPGAAPSAGPSGPGSQAPSSGDQQPDVPPPQGLTLPAARTAVPVAAATPASRVDPAAVRAAVSPLLGAKRLGGHVVVRVARSGDGPVVFRSGGGLVTPASTMKLLTTTAALQVLGPEHRFTTLVVAPRRPGRIVLVGGGDPFLARVPSAAADYPPLADLATLAGATARALRADGRTRVRLSYDASRFSGPAVNPRWEPSYVPDEVSPVSALWVDEGRADDGSSHRLADPALDAARAFAQALSRRGITVRGEPSPGVAPPASTGGRDLARVRSAPLAEIVQRVLEVSDNRGAEVLARQVAVAEGRPASFAGASRAVLSVLRGLGVPTQGAVVLDGSGLARADRLDPRTLLGVLAAASSPDRPGLRPVVASLPVAGFSGSLAIRFDTGDPAGPGRVRAKTGTLTGVHALAGTVTTVDGVVLRFVAIADRVPALDQLAARIRIDEVAAALAGCRCAR